MTAIDFRQTSDKNSSAVAEFLKGNLSLNPVNFFSCGASISFRFFEDERKREARTFSGHPKRRRSVT